MTLPNLGLETSDEERSVWLRLLSDENASPIHGFDMPRLEAARLLRDIAKLITALSEARDDVERLHQAVYDIGKEAELIMRDRDNVRYELSEARGREQKLISDHFAYIDLTVKGDAAERETIATLTAENAELTRRAADALARQPAPEPVGGNDSDRSRHFPMED